MKTKGFEELTNLTHSLALYSEYKSGMRCLDKVSDEKNPGRMGLRY